VLGVLLTLLSTRLAAAQADPCAAPANVIVAENCQTGSPASEWDLGSADSSAIEGFATDISVARGQTVRFKIKTVATAYRIDLYRLGYYNGDGARKIATVPDTATLKQSQPPCLSESSTALIDCGNWAESASWAVPVDAVSGIYLARLVREDGTVGANHVPFVVREDDGHSDLLFQTSDTTWQAYNDYGGASLYVNRVFSSGVDRAYKVSYNRPFNTRNTEQKNFLFNAEYPMVRFLERNGYDVSYSTGVDSDRRGALIGNHKIFLSVGHDEYWSGGQRANIEAARDAGVPWPSSPATRLSGRPAGRARSTARARRTGRWSPTRRARLTPGSTRSTCRAGSGPGPGATRASARQPTAAGPRTG
jgi:hypothetical protein